VLAPVFACLYPLTTAATLATAYAVAAVIDTTGIASGGIGLALALLPAIVVCWTVGRLDQRLGEIAAYRWVRHGARLVIVVLLANAAALNAGTPVGVAPRHIEGLAGFFEAMVTMPNVMPVVLALVCAQIYLVRDGSGRRYWNHKLIQWKFRPKGFRSRFPRTRSAVFAPRPAAPVPAGIQRHLDAAAAKRQAKA
jgi:chromate transport protein ChrA